VVHAPHPVTIVVPVFGDLPSLVACVESIILTVDLSVHAVLLVNDNGPDADIIETRLLALIDGYPAIRYERNPRNLGFVGTCNRAALTIDETRNDILLLNSDTVCTPGFLEELSSVLHSDPSHATVCPRSNNATIASLPYRLADPAVGRTPARTRAVFDAIAPLLPRYSVSPASMGFCILIRRELIEKHGLFDEIFSPGYGEENDFCLRMGALGYVSLIAHHALVMHEGSRSFVGLKRNILRGRHEQIVARRHPAFRAQVERYLWSDTDVADTFADVLVPRDAPATVLVLIGERSDSTSRELMINFARTLRDAGLVRVTVATGPDGRTGRMRRREILRRDMLSGIFDLAIGCSGMSDIDLAVLDRSSPRWARLVGGPRNAAVEQPASSGVDDSSLLEFAVYADDLFLDSLVANATEGLAAAAPDLARVRTRHSLLLRAADESGILVRPAPSVARRFHLRAMAAFPTLTTVTEWALLGVRSVIGSLGR
jgi:GT2 family glycosyltransferase